MKKTSFKFRVDPDTAVEPTLLATLLKHFTALAHEVEQRMSLKETQQLIWSVRYTEGEGLKLLICDAFFAESCPVMGNPDAVRQLGWCSSNYVFEDGFGTKFGIRFPSLEEAAAPIVKEMRSKR